MHKCQSTFSSLDDPMADSVDIDVNDAGDVSAQVRVYRPCADCGTEVKEYNFDLSDSVGVDEKHKGHSLEVEADDAECGTETVTKDKRGKPIKSSRYMKTLVTVDVVYRVKCSDCDEVIHEGQFHDTVQASGMDELE